MTSQQPIAEAEHAQGSTSAFSVEVEEHIFKHLSDLANKENVPLNPLSSEIFKAFLVLHRRELRQIIETIKKR